MSDTEATLRRRLERYLGAVDPTTVSGVVGVCLTGSLAAGFVDTYSDVDLTVVIENDGDAVDPDQLSETLLPESATVQCRVPLEKYSFDWDEGHFDVSVVALDDLRADRWDLETRWEYDNAEVLADPSGRLEKRLNEEVPFADGERAELVTRYVDAFLFASQWDVHRACRRGSFRAAHRAATKAVDDAFALLYLQAGEFVPRDKWLFAGLEAIPMADEEVRALTWEATRILEPKPTDLHRRVRALHALWGRLRPTLEEQELVNADTHSWEAPPDELCLVE